MVSLRFMWWMLIKYQEHFLKQNYFEEVWCMYNLLVYLNIVVYWPLYGGNREQKEKKQFFFKNKNVFLTPYMWCKQRFRSLFCLGNIIHEGPRKIMDYDFFERVSLSNRLTNIFLSYKLFGHIRYTLTLDR